MSRYTVIPDIMQVRYRAPKTAAALTAYTLTLQPDAAAGKDAQLTGGASAAKNYGASTYLFGITGGERTLLYFSLAAVPAGAICSSATLTLYQAGAGPSKAFTLTAYAIAAANTGWAEGTKNAATAGAGEPCWNAKAADGAGGVTTAWAGSAGLSTAGTDYVALALGSTSGNRADISGTGYAISLTPASIAAWFGADTNNHGLLVVPSADTGVIASSDHATAAYRPKLVIEYLA